MAKRTNRVAWGLAAILAAAVLGGAVVLSADYLHRLPEQRWRVLLLPPHQWGFVRQKIYWVGGTPIPGYIESYKCGLIEVWIRHR